MKEYFTSNAFDDLRPALDAVEQLHLAEVEQEKERKRKGDAHAREVLEKLGMKPMAIYDGGTCRFQKIILRVYFSQDFMADRVYRIDYCPKFLCGMKMQTESEYLSLHAIGNLIKIPLWETGLWKHEHCNNPVAKLRGA